MWAAERVATPGPRARSELNLTDAIVVGLVQCFVADPRRLALRARRSRPACFRGLDRVTATRLCFFLSIPALLAAGLFELKDALGGDISVGETARRDRGRRSSWPTPRSPGCCASSPTTRSRGSCPTASRWALLLLVLLATGVMSAT